MKVLAAAALLSIASPATSLAAVSWINEIDYDLPGADNAEFLEVFVTVGFTGALSDLSVVLYNGATSSRAPYNTRTLDTFTVGATIPDVGTFYYFDYPTDGIQNGSPDGVALGNAGNLIEFLSYEGSFVALGGIADGVTSTDIGVAENNSAPNQSVYRTGTGSEPSDFSWATSESLTKGALNVGQTIVPEPTTALLGALGVLGLLRRRR